MSKDTSQQDLYKQIKQGWETSQPGRSGKAKEIREGYKPNPVVFEGLKVWNVVKEGCPVVEVIGRREGMVPVVVGGGGKGRQRRPSALGVPVDETVVLSTKLVKTVDSARVLTVSDFENLSRSRMALIKATAEGQAGVIKNRAVEKEKRNEAKKRLIDIVQAKMNEVEIMNGIDNARREAVKAAVAAKIEEENAKIRAIQEAKEAMLQEVEGASKLKRRK